MSFKNAGRSPIIGVRHAGYFIMTENTDAAASYGQFYPLTDAMNVKVAHKADSQLISSDDQVSEIIYGQGSDDIEFQEKNVPLEDLARLLGHQIVNGVMIRNKDDIPPEVCFAYQSKKSNGGIEYAKYLCGSFAEPDKEAESDGEKIAPKFKTIKGSFYPRRFDGNSSKEMHSDSPSFNPDNVDGWYTTVDGTAPSAIALSSSVPAANATGVLATASIVLTFNNKIESESITLVKSSDNSVVTVTKTYDVTGKILTIAPSASLTSAGVYNVVIAGVKDVYGQSLAPVVNKFTVA